MENQVNNNQLTESIDKKEEVITSYNDNNSTNSQSQLILGVKRERENDLQFNNPDFKKQKLENFIQTNDTIPQIHHIHPGNMINNPYQPITTNHPYPSLHNPNLINPISQAGMYGYNNPPMYYYNQPGVSPGLQNYPYNSGRGYNINNFNPNTVYPGGYHYIPSAIPQAYTHAIPGTNPYSTNYSQLILSQNQPEKQKYVIKDCELTVDSYLKSKNSKEQYLSSIKPKDSSVSVIDAVNSKSGENAPNKEPNNENNPSIIQSKTLNSTPNLNCPNLASNNYTNNPNNIILSSKYSQPQINSSINVNINIGTFKQIQKDNNQNTNQTQNNIPNNNIISTVKFNNLNSNKFFSANVNNGNIPNQNIPKTFLKNNQNNSTINNQDNLTIKNDEFSDSLNDYIIRAYAKCKTELDKKKCKKSLLKIITVATEKGDINTRDFSKFPLPILPSEDKIGDESIKKNISIENNKREENIINKNYNKFFQKNEKNISIKTFNNMNINISNITSNKNNLNFNSLEELTKNTIIIGTCTDIEKQYLRLTSLPDSSQVRPEHILKKSLKMLKEKWKTKENDYNYFDEQFRSIRQDMTIQHIQNDFTVKVYEINARIAMECHDLDQFNQCQTKLINLYDNGLKGKETEFLAYRIIYMGLHKIKYDMEYLLKKLQKDQKLKNTLEISHALKTHRVLNDNNFFEFFKLYKIAPNMSSYLIEPFLPRFRIKTLQMMSVVYLTEIDLNFITEKLAFDRVENCLKFLEEHKLKINQEKTKFLCKESLPAINSNELMLTKHITSNL